MDTYKLNFTILELEIFSFLSLKSGERLSQREIAKALQVSPTAVANAVRNLNRKNLIRIEKTSLYKNIIIALINGVILPK